MLTPVTILLITPIFTHEYEQTHHEHGQLKAVLTAFNELSSSPGGFGQLKALLTAFIKLDSFPESFGQLTTLLTASNELSSLPESFGQLTAFSRRATSSAACPRGSASSRRSHAFSQLTARQTLPSNLPERFG